MEHKGSRGKQVIRSRGQPNKVRNERINAYTTVSNCTRSVLLYMGGFTFMILLGRPAMASSHALSLGLASLPRTVRIFPWAATHTCADACTFTVNHAHPLVRAPFMRRE